MIKLFFDIETIPAHEDKKEEVLAYLKSRKSYSKNGNSLSDDDLHHGTGLDGTFGRICCIGYIKEDGKITRDVIKGEEKEILKKFWEIARDVDLFVGHNIWAFDLPFIYKRSIILGVKPRFNISFARYRNEPIFDTMIVWDLWNMDRYRQVSMEVLAKALDLPSSKDEMNGSMVWSYYKQGKLDEICKYCMKDVELVRKIYYKMTFEEMPFEDYLDV